MSLPNSPFAPPSVKLYLATIVLYANDTVSLPGMLPCDGRTLPIESYMNLFSLVGMMYGGDGQNFNLPNLDPPLPGMQYLICADDGIYPPRG